MRTGQSGEKGSRRGPSAPAPGARAPAEFHETARGFRGFCQTKDAFEILLSCSTLTHHLLLALQAEGVNASVKTPAIGAGEVMIHVPAGDKGVAIEILLRALRDAPRPPSSTAEPGTALAA